jgi:Tol biopolymer transport system component
MPDGPDWPLGNARQLRPGQRAEVWIAGVDGGPAQRVYTSDTVLLEAPNWAPDGQALLLNGDGLLWRLNLHPRVALEQVPLDGLPPINNDHVVDAARHLIYLSANDGHIWVAPLAGGTSTRVTHDPGHYHFLHGVSPDGKTLAFVELPVGDFSAAGRLALISSVGGPTWYPEAGSKQLAKSDTVDWFPHISPDGEFATYVSFPTGTLGHPADLDVEVPMVRTSNWADAIARYRLFGGQGTINVNSWSPDSRRFAFMAYPIESADTTR